MTAISCPFLSRRCETSASTLKEPSASNPSGTSFWTSLECARATRTTQFLYATCYLCLDHVCYLCLDHGPSRKTASFIGETPHEQFTWQVWTKDAPSRGLSLCHGSACQAGVIHQASWDSSIFPGEPVRPFGSLAPPNLSRPRGICYLLFVIPGEPKASPARHGFPLTQNL
jgi:hypothetical protein